MQRLGPVLAVLIPSGSGRAVISERAHGNELSRASDFRRLGPHLDVDAVVIGSITDDCTVPTAPYEAGTQWVSRPGMLLPYFVG